MAASIFRPAGFILEVLDRILAFRPTSSPCVFELPRWPFTS
jgi:hypothetical protein